MTNPTTDAPDSMTLVKRLIIQADFGIMGVPDGHQFVSHRQAAELITHQLKEIEALKGENVGLHLAINDALHWLARAHFEDAENVLRAQIESPKP